MLRKRDERPTDWRTITAGLVLRVAACSHRLRLRLRYGRAWHYRDTWS